MNDNNGRDRELDEAAFASDEVLSGAAPQSVLALDHDERLPWLESADDDEEDGGIDTARLVRFVAFAIVLLALILGGIWFINHRGDADTQIAEGGIIPAPTEPYKSEPADKGGKTFAGTGDSAFAVSEGKATQAKLAGSEDPVAAPAPSVSPTSGANGGTGGEAAAGGVGVQVGAYSSADKAEAGWARLSSSQAVLKSLKHRVIEGSADIGTVYRLQAVTADIAAANALCSTLKASGVACQVKR